MSCDSRRGALLILVAGLCAMLATIAIAFLLRMRAEAEESIDAVREVQAHVMLVAACNYVQEAARLGWDNPNTPNHEEAFGWVDVRDGTVGPKPATTGIDDDARFPIHGRPRRFPMYVMARPPFAVRSIAAPNPIEIDPASPWAGQPLLRHRDPEPVATAAGDFATGDRRPRDAVQNGSWFRLYRDGPATFVVTCGSGGSGGFRTWQEVIDAGAQLDFAGDPTLWRDDCEHEVRLWYRIEWSPAVTNPEYHVVNNLDSREFAGDVTASYPINASQTNGGQPIRSQSHPVNQGGTIQWIQRLQTPPTDW